MVSPSECKQHPDDFTDALGEEGEGDQLLQDLPEQLIKLLNPTSEACSGKIRDTMGFENKLRLPSLQFSAAVLKI